MTTTTKTTANKATDKAKTPAQAKDAIALLKADHAKVNELFADYEKMRSDTKKKELVAEICTTLSVHAQVEREIFYPAVMAALKDKQLTPETKFEHVGMQKLIAQLDGSEPDGAIYDGKVHSLAEYVQHHIQEEQDQMFSKLKDSSLDLIELGGRMALRKADLFAARNLN